MMLIPGPVEVPRSVQEASTLVINHRSEKFREIVSNLESLMKKHFSANRVALLTGSGTLAVEAMVYSLTKPNEKVVTFPYGEFGKRLAESLKRRGTNVKVYEKAVGSIASLEEIKMALDENKDATTVAIVHNETSSGMAFRNLEEVVNIARKRGLKILVDSVSGFAAYKILVNEWKIDAVATGSQKALASVPGMAFVALSEESVNELVKESLPSYLDIALHLKFQDKGETPFTPAVGVFNSSLRAAELLAVEGIENRWKRHEACARFVREVTSAYGFSLFGNETNFSNTVVAGVPPVPDYKKKLKEFNIEISGGIGELKDKIVRFGLLGVVDDRAVNKLLEATAKILDKKYEFTPPKDCKLPELLQKEVIWS